ncbi:MAG: DUF481 domain-containing protein [Bryobacterales bacterium]|nr:DUF481 domain-containing protein [Bryobacterales bacterium]
MLSDLTRLGVALCLVCAAASADQVTLKNGDRLTGKIVTTDDKKLILKTDYAGDVSLDRAAVISIVSDEALNVTPKTGPMVSGKVETAGGNIQVGGQSIAISDAYIRDAASQKAWEREQERLNHPKLNDFWTGSFGFNLANASGNARTTAIGTNGNAARIAGKNKMQLYFNQVYAKQSTTVPYGVTANAIHGGFRMDRDITKKLFVFGTTDFDYDQFLSLDLRSVFGGGLGYHIFKNDKGYWDLGVGGVWNREKFGEIVSSSGRQPAFVRNSGEILISEESSYKLLAKLIWFQRAQFFPNLTNHGEYRFNFDTNATVPVLKWLEWNIGYSNRYLSNPPAGFCGSDLASTTRCASDSLLTTGVRLSFDQTKR